MAERVPVTEEPTIGRIVSDVSKDVSSLIRNEIALAKSEIKVSVRAGGTGVALFAAAGFMAVLAIIMLSIAIGFFIHFTGLDLAWCFLIVFGAYILITAILALIGIRKVKKVRAPEAAINQLDQAKGLLSR